MKTEMKHTGKKTGLVNMNGGSAPIQAGQTSSTLPEFGRFQDVQRLFGLKRGYTYNLIREGKIKSVCIRKPGAATGIRLIHLQSVRDFLLSHMK